MQYPLVRSIALAAAIAVPAFAHADSYLVQIASTVTATDTNSGLASVMPVGSSVVMSFTVDSTNFVDSGRFSNRGYAIDTASFSLVANGTPIAVTLPANSAFVLSNDNPRADGVFLATLDGVDRFANFAATVPGNGNAFTFSFTQTWSTAYSPLGSVKIDDAVGTLDPTGVLTSSTGLRMAGNTSAATFSPASVTISAVPEPASYGLMGLGLALVGVARRRQRNKS